MTTPVLHLVAGPNGAGKTTFYERLLGPVTGLDFVNADLIAAEEWPGDELRHAYDASALAQQERERRLAERTSFVAETVFSHASKVDLVRGARRAGYIVILHVIVVPVDQSVRRVEERVRHGGHDVPEAKVRERHGRLWPIVREAMDLAEETSVYDNSLATDPFRKVLAYRLGQRFWEHDPPTWLPEALRS